MNRSFIEKGYLQFFVGLIDRTVLIMTYQRKDSYGAKDVYVSFPLSDDYFSEPLNIGKSVNQNTYQIVEKNLYQTDLRKY